jgi:hypothetical protein
MDIKNIMLKLAEQTQSQVVYEYGNDQRCNGGDENDPIIVMSSEMSDLMYTHHILERAAESQGIELVHYDEYTVDDDGNKAWRTEPDSYFWTPSCVYDDHGNFLTPDDDIDLWIDWAKNDPARCLTSNMVNLDDLMELGYAFHPDEDDVNESGWHQGMDADPRKTYQELRGTPERPGEFPQSDIIFWLKETSQFYSTWQVLVRPTTTTVSAKSYSHDQQVDDAWSWVRGEMPEDDFDLLVQKFPEMERIVWSGSWFDTEAMGVDVEYTSWVADALEETGRIHWEDGEPYGILN